jgi:hypothetical protein
MSDLRPLCAQERTCTQRRSTGARRRSVHLSSSGRKAPKFAKSAAGKREKGGPIRKGTQFRCRDARLDAKMPECRWATLDHPYDD